MKLFSRCLFKLLPVYLQAEETSTAAASRYALRFAIKNRYIDKLWTDEQFDDVAHMALRQCPIMRSWLVRQLADSLDDEKAAAKWETFDECGEYSKEFKDGQWHDSTPGYLSLPKDVAVVMVDEPARLATIEADLARIAEQDFPVIGVDAEWPPFSGRSRASVMQVAFPSTVFIVDLDAFPTPHVHDLFNAIFGNWEIYKIGFCFHEDLNMLRMRDRKSAALGRPESIVCIRKLVAKLIVESSNRGHTLDRILPPSSEKASFLAIQEAEERRKKVDLMGLSTLCAFMLGLPLDKSEQRSVWERRPLRYLQMRYAALDAYACIMIYDKCRKWAEATGVDLEEAIGSSTLKF